MISRRTQPVCIICLLLGFVSGWVQAATRTVSDRAADLLVNNVEGWGPPGSVNRAHHTASRWRNMPIHRAQQVLPASWSGYRPAVAYGRHYPTAWQKPTPPRIEVELSEANPYVQQTILYKLRVISASNLQTLNINLPISEQFILDKINGPVTRVRKTEGQREIINEYVYALTPLKDGEIHITPVQITGILAEDKHDGVQWNGQSRQPHQNKTFDVTSNTPQILRVAPADPSVHPWLPLHKLTLDTKLERPWAWTGNEKSLTLSVTLKAEGIGGYRIPSLESQLRAPGLHVYREGSVAHRKVSADGTRLVGQRSEIYTLVNAAGTGLSLPAVRIPWWNVDSGQREEVALPLKPLIRETDAVKFINRKVANYEPVELNLGIFLLTITGASLSVWFWLWSRGKPLGRRLSYLSGMGYQSILNPIINRALWLMRALSPIAAWRKSRRRLILAIPLSMRLWYCVHCIQHEADPSKWCQMFKFLTYEHLNLPQHVPLSKIADEIIALQPPGTKTVRLRRLIQDLSGAIYGSKSLDFVAWKKALKQQLLPVWFRRKQQQYKMEFESAGLPKLNPF